jgi:hypothetical protein
LPILLRPFVLAACALALSAGGCAAPPPDSVGSSTLDCATTASPSLHVVIGVSGHQLPAEARRGALKAVLDQLTAREQPGSGALIVQAYPLAEQSIAAQPLRLDLPCLPAAPEVPDLRQVPTFERARRLDAYRKALASTRRAVEQSRRQLATFGEQLLALEPHATSTDVWGFLGVAADELARVGATQRDVIVVARDEENDAAYCDGCQPLGGARVHFLAFDQLTPADLQRRRTEWSAWLAATGASTTTFTRSNETIPALFGSDAASSPAAPLPGVQHA